MMARPVATTTDLRRALGNLAAIAAGAAAGRADARARRSLRREIEAAQEILRADIEGVPALAVADADALVEAYIAAGGNWHALTAAVNRRALHGATRRAC